MTQNYSATLAIALALSLSAKPALLAQADPLWQDRFGPLPNSGILSALHVDEAGATFVAGYRDGDDGDGRVEATISRLDPDDDALASWTTTVAGPGGGQLLPISLLRRGPDSLTVIYVETGARAPEDGGFGDVAGRAILQAVARADGGAGVPTVVDFPSPPYRPSFARAVPGSTDFVLASRAPSGGGGEASVARVRLDGSVAWVTDQFAPNAFGFEIARVLDAAFFDDRLYVQGNLDALTVLDPEDGTQAGQLTFPFDSGGFPFFSNARLSAVGDTLWWLNRSDLSTSIEVAAVTVSASGEVAAAPFTTVGTEGPFLLYDPLAVMVSGGEVAVFSISNGELLRSTFDAAGDSLQTTVLPRGNFNASPQPAPLAQAIRGEARVVLAGGSLLPGANTAPAVGRYDFAAETAEVSALPDQRAGDAPAEVLDLVERVGGGAHVLYVGNLSSQLAIRTLDAAGDVVADEPINTGLEYTGYFGAATLPSGDIVAFIQQRPAGSFSTSSLYALRLSPGGAVLDSRELLSAAGSQTGTRSQARATDDGNVRFVFTIIDGQVAGRSFSEAIELDADLETVREAGFPDTEGIEAVADAIPIPGSEDFLVYETGQLRSRQPDYVARVGPDLTTVVWYRAAVDEDDDPIGLLSVSLLSDGSVATVGEESGVRRLDLSDGSVLEAGDYDEPSGVLLPADVRAVGEDPLVVYLAEEIDGTTGLPQFEVRVANLSLGTGDFVTAAGLPVYPAPLARDFGEGVIYREFGGRAYVALTQQFGTGRQGLVVAYAQTLTPSAEVRAPARALAVGPNPVAAGASVTLDADLIGYAVSLYDGLGRRIPVGDVRAESPERSALLVPEVSPGVYRLVATGPSGETAVASLRVY